jgi:hypothetical protein
MRSKKGLKFRVFWVVERSILREESPGLRSEDAHPRPPFQA